MLRSSGGGGGITLGSNTFSGNQIAPSFVSAAPSSITIGAVATSAGMMGDGSNMVIRGYAGANIFLQNIDGSLNYFAMDGNGPRTGLPFSNTASTTLYMGTATGSADALVLTPTNGVTAYATGAMYCFRAASSNATTTPTVNISTLGAKTMVKRAATALAAGDIVANAHYWMTYNGTSMQLINPTVP